MPPLISERRAVPRPPQQPVLRARRGRVLPRLARRARRSAASPRRSTATSTSSRTTTGACSASSSARTTRRRPRALLDAAEALAARARPRPHGRPDGLHDQRRVRRARRGLRAPADHPHELDAPATTRALLEGAGPGEGDGHAACGSSTIQGREQRPPGDLESGRAGRVQARDHRAADAQAATCEAEIDRFLEVYNAAWERNWGFVPLTEKEVRHYAKTSSRCSTRTGRSSPRRTARPSAPR